MKFLTLFLLCWIVLSSAAVDKQLQFNEQGKFKVVQFTDLHYGNNQYENDQTAAVQDAILAAEQPDLVIITGDLISGYEWDGIEAGWFEKLWRKLVAPMKKHNTRWAIALGNHDVEGDLNGRAIVELESTEELSLTQQGPSDISGATNYYIPIYRYNSSDIGHILWVFDSGNKGCLGISGWGCVEYNQVSWYRNASRTLATQENNGRAIPALAFFHIPLYEHLDLWNVRGVQGDLAEGEGVCCSSVNTGLYAAMKEIGDIKGVYCGHDHNNDYIGDYHGITLGFGRKTGYGCYGPPWGWQHGARVLEIIDSTAGANTWLRLEDGSVEIQKQNPASMRKFLGCCSMEGHGRVAMGWLGILVSILATAATIALIAVFVVAVLRACRKRKGKTYDSVPNEGEGDDSGCDAAGLVSRYPVRVNAPVPRQRRSIGQEVA